MGKGSIGNGHGQVTTAWTFTALVPLVCKVICNKAFFKTVNKSNRACLVPAVLRVRLGRDGSFLAEGDNSSSGTGVSSGRGRGGAWGCVLGTRAKLPGLAFCLRVSSVSPGSGLCPQGRPPQHHARPSETPPGHRPTARPALLAQSLLTLRVGTQGTPGSLPF